ncbi:hypothetical protein ACFL3M_01330 [Patescibacteria group bacterium]
MDGDGTVVTPSAVMMGNVERYYFDLELYNSFGEYQRDREHANILEIDFVQALVKNIIFRKDEELKYITKERPEPDPDDKRIRLKMKSPVDVHLFDEKGRHTGIVEDSDTNSDSRIYEEGIPNSYYWEFGEKKYLGSGKKDLEVNLIGTGVGVFTFEIEEIAGGEIENLIDFSDVPVFEGMKASLEINEDQASEMEIDLDGDGEGDFSIIPGDGRMKTEASILILEKILKDLGCHRSIKKSLTRRVIQVRKLISGGKIVPAKNILESMVNHLEAIGRKNDLGKLKISKEEIEKLINIIEKIKINIEK